MPPTTHGLSHIRNIVRGEARTATSPLVRTLGICGGRCSLTIASLFMTPPCDRLGSTISKHPLPRGPHAQRGYAIANPMGWDGYSKDIWGMTASDGPGHPVADFKGKPTQFEGYSAYGPKGMPDENDIGHVGADSCSQFYSLCSEIRIPAANTCCAAIRADDFTPNTVFLIHSTPAFATLMSFLRWPGRQESGLGR